ncbi:MAG: acyl-[ACP]--phospholipid O-acyltransferase [Thiohalomonadales bacterium]
MDKLYKITGFFPYVLVVFLNAFVDLGHKIVIQNTIFKIYDGQTQIILTAIVNGLILLPFILLFSPAGFISDRYRKPVVMRISAIIAVFLTLIITFAYYQGMFQTAFAMTFLLAVQSAIYSPAKYGYIKELVGQARLAPMNAMVQSITMVAILLGVFAFSILFELRLEGQTYNNETEILRHIAPLGWLLVLCSIVEAVMAYRLPIFENHTEAASQKKNQFSLTKFASTNYLKTNLQDLHSNRNIWLSIVGLSVFWGISQVVLASFPAFAKEVLAENNTIVIQGMLASSGIGIVIGSLIAGRLSRFYIETGSVAVGAIGIVTSLFLIPQLDSVLFLTLDILAMGFFGGLFIVPLNAIIQFQAPEDRLGTVLAGNNWVQNVVMISFLGLTVLFGMAGLSSVGLFYIISIVALVGAAYTVYQLPQSLLRILFSGIFAARYRISVHGFENLPARGAVLMLGNHISFLDWAIVQIACPRPIRFVMHQDYYKAWYIKWFLDIFGVIPIASGNSKQALEQINNMLKSGEVVCLFPEGGISRSGQLGQFKHGYEKTVEDVEGVILPFYLRGLWGSRFSRSSSHMKTLRGRGLRRDVIVAFGPPLPIETKAVELKNRVFDLSINAWQDYTDRLPTIPASWIQTVKRQGNKLCMTEAKAGRPLSGYKALTAAIGFSQLIAKRSPEQNVGLLLPTSSASMLTNMAVLLRGKTVVNLNYSASIEALKAAVDKAELRSIYTSTRFVKKLQQRGIDLQAVFDKVEVYYLEELATQIGPLKKLALFSLTKLLPASWLYRLFGTHVDISEPAAILFSSGSEGAPKGVVLSHKNLLGNIKQVSDMMDIQQEDIMMGSLPQFHAFGLTVCGLLPLVEGVPVIFHPDPTDVLNIAKAITNHKVTVMFGTSTFLRLYVRNRKVLPLMLDSIRLVVAGAERLNSEVRTTFEQKFNRPIYEGYGTTETTPVAGVNIPDRLDLSTWRVQTGNKLGTVGLPLPGSSFRIVDPVTMATLPCKEDGLILIGGTQVMLGYLNDAEKTQQVMVELDGQRWYKSGDKGHLDEDGFLTVVDRYSRFAKIAGEMISLGAIEACIDKLTPEGIEILSTALPDGKKGEKVVLLFAGDIDEDALKDIISQCKLSPLMVPASLLKVDAIPKLGTGKSDFGQAKILALAM